MKNLLLILLGVLIVSMIFGAMLVIIVCGIRMIIKSRKAYQQPPIGMTPIGGC